MTKSILSLKNISKNFGMTAALSNMSIDLYPGEVHAIVGENGAGKSTMIKIMTGIHQPSSGALEINGEAVTISGTRAAREHGVAAIYQEPMVFPDFDVTENIFASSKKEGWIQRRDKLRKKALALIERLGMELDVDRIASGLTLAEQQAAEIARALNQDVRVLIMDEPTASLSAYEAAQLRRIATTLAEQGVAVVYISHRLEEIFDIAQRVTVIRDGQHISTKLVSGVTSDGMIAEMVGREVGNYLAKAESHTRENTILEVRDFAYEGVFRGINFDVHYGEILCMAGLIGARRTDVALSLFGVHPATSGSIKYKGEMTNITSARQAMNIGIAYVSEDRRKFGLAMPMSIRSNVTLATLADFLSPRGIINRRKEAEVTQAFRDRLNIRTPNIEVEMGMLSGGNQQKVMLAKWLNMKPDLLILDEPTRGIDVGAKAEVHDLIRDFVAKGGTAIVISSDLLEVLAMGDRILVMREGHQMGILNNEETSQENIMALATGQREAA